MMTVIEPLQTQHAMQLSLHGHITAGVWSAVGSALTRCAMREVPTAWGGPTAGLRGLWMAGFLALGCCCRAYCGSSSLSLLALPVRVGVGNDQLCLDKLAVQGLSRLQKKDACG